MCHTFWYLCIFCNNFFCSDVPIGHLVGTVNANDPDIDAVLRFEWFGPKDASSDEGFAVNPETGYDFRVCIE